MSINAKAERLLGVEADSLVFETYFITEAFTYNLSRWTKVPVFRTFLAYAVFLWACIRYQRFHFYFDRGILPPLRPFEFNRSELAILRRLGKQVFFWTYGADVRTKIQTEALGAPNCCTQCPAPGSLCVCNDEQGQANVSAIREKATAMFAMGDMVEYTPGSDNNLFFWPVDLNANAGEKYAPHYPSAAGSTPVRIVHAPNHRHFKGTRYIQDAVDRLKKKGLPVELVMVERVPNDKALDIYRTADIIFDQCLIGFHGYFAIEAMAMGKPVMCFIRKPSEYLLSHEECPIINAPYDRLEEILERLISDRGKLRALGMEGREYVENYFSMEAFAKRLKNSYECLGI
jgi:hypothetical protein